jgi:hypothetical protein
MIASSGQARRGNPADIEIQRVRVRDHEGSEANAVRVISETRECNSEFW